MEYNVNNKEFEYYLSENLTRVFGSQKAKKIIEDVRVFKRKHPNESFSFIFDEHGGFKAIKK
jgi:hypothetical protein